MPTSNGWAWRWPTAPAIEYVEDTALAFEFVAGAYREDFDEDRPDCESGGRTLAALAGDLVAAIARVLASAGGSLGRRRPRLCTIFARQRRSPADFWTTLAENCTEFEFGGRCSTLLVEGPGPPRTGRDLRRAVRAGASDPATDWDEICRQARTGRRLTARGRAAGRVLRTDAAVERTGAGNATIREP